MYEGQAIITRHDLRYAGQTGKTIDIVPPYKKDTGSIAKNTVYYPLGDATTKSSKQGYLYIAATCSNCTGGNRQLGYEVIIGNKTYHYTQTIPPYHNDEKNAYWDGKVVQVFKVPLNVTVSFQIIADGTFTDLYCAAACSAE